MAVGFGKLAIFIAVSLHYVAAQGTTPPPPSDAPSLVITPISYSVDYGSTVLMTCVAYLGLDTEDHSATTITWSGPAGQQLSNDSDSMVTIYSETQTQNGMVFLESILEICSVDLSGAGEFSCRAANSVGGESFSWNITFTEEIAAPELIVTPVSQDVSYRDTVLMACVASGYPEPEITWRRNGELLDPASSDLINIYTEVVSEVGLNFTESIIEICGVGFDDVGSFTCTASNDAGNVTSAPFVVGILPNTTEVALVITPSSDTVNIHSTVLLVCVAQGDPAPSISWEFEGSIITNETSLRHTVYDEMLNQGDLMFVESILEICSIELAEGGDYTCNATNGFTSETNTTTLSVVDNREIPMIVVSPNVTDPFTEGDTVALACTATGRPYPTIQWYKDGVLITNDSLTSIYNEEVENNGLLFTTSILEVCSVGSENIGSYSCVASNSAGNDSFDFDVQVMLGEVSVVISPVDYTIDESATMVAVCVGTGFPQPTISWTLDGSPLQNSSRVSIYEEVMEESGITFVQSFLEVCSVNFMDAGLYECTVANRLVNASSNFTLTVNNVGEPPQLVVTPNASIEVDAGTTVTYVCVGFGEDEPPNIIWEFGDQLLNNDTSSLVTIYESQVEENRLVFSQSILELCSVEVENAGMYSCTANNSRGSNSSTFTLNVRPRVAPTIVVSPNVTDPFTEGDTVALACTATGRPYPTIQWYKDGVLITNDSLTSIYNEEVENNGLLFTTSILEVCSVGSENSGAYSCVAENPAGNDTSEFDVQVMLGEATVVISPVDYTIDESATMVAVCVGTGFPQPTISWTLDGSPLQNSSRVSIYEEVMEESGITFVQSFLEVCSVNFMDAGLYECTVANRLVNASSNFTLTVNNVGEPPQLVVTPNASIEVDAGTTVTYVCVGFGEDEPPNIIWEFGDQLLNNDTSSLVTIYESQVEENRLVFSQSILELCSVEVENAGMYSCTANNSRGSNSSTFTLNVRPRIAPTIVIRPNVTDPFTEGDTVALACTATAKPFATIQWYKDGIELTNGSLTSIYNEQFEGNGLLFTTSILEVCSVGSEDSGTYSCVASNFVGNDSVEFDVLVQQAEVSVVISPVDYTIDESATMVAVCVGTGFPQPTISWTLDGSPLQNSSRVSIYEEVIEESGITFVQSFLEVCSVNFMDAGLYECTVANRLVNASSNFTLTVNNVGEPPQLVVAPNASIEVDAGTTVTYVCVGFGEDEPPNIIWEFGDQLLNNDTSSLVTIYESQVEENRLVFSQSILELCSVEVENAGMYSCTANNSRGSNSSTFTLNVRPRIAPTIVIRPNVTDPFTEGDTVSLVCTATGRPFATIQWYKDGIELTNGSLTSIYNEQFEGNGLLFTTSILEVCSVGSEDSGTYSCIASNFVGNDSVEFDVLVQLAEVSVVISPVDYTIDESATMVAVCVGTGFPQPTISWTLDGSPLQNSSRVSIYEEVIEESGITFVQSFLEVCSVNFMDAGLYECTVANRLVNASSNFTLSVNNVGEPPQLVVAPNASIEVDAGTTVTYVCVGFGEDEPPNIIWEFGDQLLNNDTSSLVTIYDSQLEENGLVFSQSILELCSVEVENAGMYSCTANNSLGSNSSTFTLNVRPRTAPAIVIRPNVTDPFLEGDTVSLVCTATGRPFATIQWYKDGIELTNGSLTSIYNEQFEDNGLLFTTSILEVCSVGSEDSGTYSCVARNFAGNDSVEFEVQVQQAEASVVIAPSNYTVDEMTTFVAVCVGTGFPQPTISWTRNDNRLENSSRITITEEVMEESGITFVQSFLEVCSVNNDTDSGVYQCTVENRIVNTSVYFYLTVNTVGEHPQIVIAPNASIEVDAGTTVTYVCVGFGEDEPPNIIWEFGDQLLNNDTSSLVTIYDSQLEENGLVFSQSILELCSVEVENAGMYSCTANNSLGSNSSTFTLNIYNLADIVVAPPSNVFVRGGDTILIVCAGVGLDPQISWSSNSGVALTNASDDRVTIYEEVGTQGNTPYLQSILEICSTQESDEGVYKCTITSRTVSNSVNFTLSVNVTPAAIVIGPADIYPIFNSSVFLTCIALGYPLPMITWYREGERMDDPDNIESEVIEEGGERFVQSTLLLCSTQETARYNCTASNGITGDVTTSVTARVVVEVPVSITAQPSDTTVLVNNNATFTCLAYGTSPIDVTWFRMASGGEVGSAPTRIDDSQVIRSEVGTTEVTVTSTLTLASVWTGDDGAVFYCEVTNNLTEAGVFSNQSDSVTLTVQSVPIVTPVSPVVIGLMGSEVIIGITIESAYPVVMATQVTWFHEGDLTTPLTSAADSRYTFSNDMRSLTIYPVSYDDEGSYTIMVSHVTGNQTVTIHINVQAGAMIIGGPQSLGVPIGQSASFSCNVTGEPTPTIMWQFAGTEVTEGSKYTIMTSPSGDVIMSVLTINNLVTADSGVYICFVENDHMNESSDATLQVQTGPIVSAETQLTEALTGDDLKLVFTISNDIPKVLPSDMTWTFTSSLTGVETRLDDSADQRFQFSSDGLTLTIMSASLLDDGVYTVRASNPAGSSSDYTRVTVYAAPYINTTGHGETVIAGGRVTFTCSADGVPTPSISWLKDGTIISAASAKRYELTKDTLATGVRDNINETFTSVLTIVGISESDAGLYRCTASNGQGQNDVLSMPFNLTVTPAPLPNFCESNPCQNGASCKSGVLAYICTCTAGFKGTNCDEAITVNTPPKIELGPQTTFTGIYSSVNLTCVVSGSPQPTIQWFKDDSLLPGEVYPSYYIQSVGLNDRGVYHCVATNSEGTVKSNPPAVINILGLQQYIVDLFIPLGSFGVTTFSDEVVQQSRELVNSLNEQLAGSTISGVLIFSVTPLDDQQKFVTHDATTDIVKVSLVLTVLVLPLPDGLFGRNLFDGETLVTPEVLEEFTDEISVVTNDLGFEANVTQPTRLDGCATEQTRFNPQNTDERTLTWVEAAIGAVATTSCPCGELEIGREATRVCMGNFTTGGTWAEPDYSDCDFTESTWSICDAIQSGVGSLLKLTGTPDPNDIDHVGIAVSTRYIEQQMGPASGNATASNQLLSLIDNLLQYPDQALKNAHEEFNTSARMMTAMERLSDSYPFTTPNPLVIVKDMYVIVIYDSLSPQMFAGQVVFANIDAEFTTDAFQESHISFNSFDRVPTASIGLPRSLLSGRNGDHRIVFNFFLNDGFFIRRDSYIAANNLNNSKLGGLAVAAHIAGGVKVTDLGDPVNMTFTINPKYRTGGNTTCSYWDQSLDNYYGGWSSRGCRKVSGSDDNVLCHCTHLTSFGLLVDTSPRSVKNDSSISRITSLGPVILLLLALIVIFSYLISSLRSSPTGVFLINFCASLVALCISYIASNYATSNEAACKAFSFFLHFTLLVSAGAMAIMLFFMVYAPYTASARRIAFTAAITTNLLFSVVVAILSIAPNPDNYFHEEFCRPTSYPYWFGLLLVGGIELLATAVLFIVGIIVRKRQPRSKEEYKSFWIEFFGLFIVFMLFYIAWGFGLPAVHPLNLGPVRLVFQVIFLVATIVLGILMTVFFCILSPDIREAWKSLFCRFMPGHHKGHDIQEHRDIEDNIYMTDRTAAGTKLKEDPVKDVSFTFTGNVYENPLANDYEDTKPSGAAAEGKAAEGTDEDADSIVKMDLTPKSDSDDDLKQTKNL